MTMAYSVLFLFILTLGTAFGAGLYESRIVIPRWFPKSNDGSYQVDSRSIGQFDVGRRFWAFVTTLPLTVLTLASLFIAWQTTLPNRGLWLVAAGIAFVERVGTFAFFIPTLIRLQTSKAPEAPDTRRLARVWISANYLRNALVLMAWISAILSISN